MKEHREKKALYLKNFIFGVEDSLVSTVGMLSGIAIAGTPRSTVLLAGMVLIFVEAFSMGVGSFLSEQASEGYTSKKEPEAKKTVVAAVIMWASYFFAGFIPLAPYILMEVGMAFWVSIGLSLVTLFILGVISARVSHLKLLRHGLKMLIIGGIAIGLGVAVGTFANNVLMGM